MATMQLAPPPSQPRPPREGGDGQRGMISADAKEVNIMKSQQKPQSKAESTKKRDQIGTVTCTNRLDLWKAFESKARVAGEKFGCKVTVTSVRYKATGEEVPRRESSSVGA